MTTNLTRERLGFVSLYLTCLVATMRMIDGPRATLLLGLGSDEIQNLVSCWHRTAEDAREASEWMQYHNVNVLQAIL